MAGYELRGLGRLGDVMGNAAPMTHLIPDYTEDLHLSAEISLSLPDSRETGVDNT